MGRWESLWPLCPAPIPSSPQPETWQLWWDVLVRGSRACALAVPASRYLPWSQAGFSHTVIFAAGLILPAGAQVPSAAGRVPVWAQLLPTPLWIK